METVKELIALTRRKRELEAELEEVQRRIAELEERIVAEWVEAGVSRARVDGYTVYLSREIWAAPEGGDHEGLAKALAALGLTEFAAVRVNHARLSAWVRELYREGQELPEAVAPLIRVSETYKIRVRKEA